MMPSGGALPRRGSAAIFFINPERTVADLEAALRNTRADQAQEIVRAFFSERSVDMLLLQPDDFIAVIVQALADAD